MFRVSGRTLVMIIVVVGLCLPVVYHCGFRIGYHEGLKTVGTLRVGFLFADIHQIALFVAENQGLFDHESDFEFKYFEYLSGSEQMIHFEAGELDMGYVGIVPALRALSKGADFKIVASANLEGSAIVAKPEIADVSGLDGKLVGTPGIGTIQNCLLDFIENKENIKVKRKHHRIPDLPLELEKGELDAFIAWEPFCAEVVVKGIGHVVYTSGDILENHQCCVFYISGRILREDRGLAERLVRAHVKGVRFAMERENDAIKIFVDKTGKSEEVVRESWKRMVWDYSPNIDSIKLFAKWLNEKEGWGLPDIDLFVENAVDRTLLAEVLG